MNQVQWYLLLRVVSRAIGMIPEICDIMESERNITIEELMPTPKDVLKARIREREGLEEPGPDGG